MNRRNSIISLVFTLIVLAGCQAPLDVDIPITIPVQSAPSPTPIPPTLPPPEKTLFVCLQREPESLYIYSDSFLYGEAAGEALTILQALYDGPIDHLGSQPLPVILNALPDLESGTVRFESTEFSEPDVYLNPVTLQPENLRIGDPYLPSGCQSPDCIQTYRGGPVLMDQMLVEFRMLSEIRWSDGEAVTAADSVYSFELDRDGASPTTKYLVDRTSSYEALDEYNVLWRGIPGYSELVYQNLFWHPLPQHRGESLTALEMLSSDEANRMPLGWGAYVIERWVEGDRLELIPNQVYFRQGQGYPYFDRLVFRFIGPDERSAVQQLLTSECDVLDESLLSPSIWPTLVEYAENGQIQVASSSGSEILRLEFNTSPVGRPGEAFFQTDQARQAVAACIDRSALVDSYPGGLAALANAFHAGSESQSDPGERVFGYDPEQGKEQVRFLGWVDDDEDPETARVGWGVPGVYNGTRFEVTLLFAEGGNHQILATGIQSMLHECGISVELAPISPEELTEGFPDGLVFGRQFDLALWSWPDWHVPLCEMFAKREIPSQVYPFGVNASGFSDASYDMACDRLLLGNHEMEAASLGTITTIFQERVPALPLVRVPRLVTAAEEICGLASDSLVPSLLWNIEALANGDGCP